MEKRAIFELDKLSITDMDKFRDQIFYRDHTATITFKENSFLVECEFFSTNMVQYIIRAWTGKTVEPRFIGGNNE